MFDQKNMLRLSLFCLTCIFFPRINAERLCVPGDVCDIMNENEHFKSSGLVCVPARDRLDCIEKIHSLEADITVTSDSELYLAHLLHGNNLTVIAETRDQEYQYNVHRYEGVAVVRKSTVRRLYDLKYSKSCHTGYWRTAGWHIPMTNLRAKNLIQSTCSDHLSVVEQDMDDVSTFFSSACIPGPWAPDEATDKILKKKYKSMCSECGSPGSKQCSGEDEYSGYSGALKCLLNGADVAWSKYSEVLKFFKTVSESEKSEYRLLCPDDRLIDISSSATEITNCAWAGRPWNTWIVRTEDRAKRNIQKTLTELLMWVNKDDSTKAWVSVALGSSGNSVFQDVLTNPPKAFLTNVNFLTTFSSTPCPNPDIKMCVESQVAMDKCLLLSKAMEATRIRPLLKCIVPKTGETCMATVGRESGVITTLDGAEVYTGHKIFDTEAIVTEMHDGSDASYYAVAVVKKNSGINSFEDLSNKKSCHTGLDKTSGWKMPVATLIEMDLLPSGDCDFAKEMSEFFSKSCVPGAKNLNVDEEVVKSLCALCVGSSGDPESTKCSKTADEAYFGYTGAFRCLVETGDVAFIKHTTVEDNTDGKNSADWAKHLKKSDYRLLCPSGGTAPVDKYKTCNLEKVPAHKVVIGPDSSDLEIEEARIQLLRASKSIKSTTFDMFGTFKGKKDLIFKNSATSLANIPTDNIHASLQESYNEKLEVLNECGASHSDSNVITSNIKLTIAAFAFIFIGY